MVCQCQAENANIRSCQRPRQDFQRIETHNHAHAASPAKDHKGPRGSQKQGKHLPSSSCPSTWINVVKWPGEWSINMNPSLDDRPSDVSGSGILVPGKVFLVPVVRFWCFRFPGRFLVPRVFSAPSAGGFSVPRFGFGVPGMVCLAPKRASSSRNGVSGYRPDGRPWRCFYFPYGVSGSRANCSKWWLANFNCQVRSWGYMWIFSLRFAIWSLSSLNFTL